MAELPDLEHLINAILADTPSDDPLGQLAAAARMRDDLDELAEEVLGHFVEQARQAGCSWSQIGTALGVSKQAAQQRHTAAESVARRLLGRMSERRRGRGGGLFRRFSDPAREAVVLAQEEARALNHHHCGTEHVLLGLLRVRAGVAAQALGSLDVSPDDVRARIAELAPPGETTPPGHIPFTAGAKKALQLSLRECIRLKHNSIGTEHVLLGLLRLGDDVALQILNACGVDDARAREAVLGLLARPA